MEFSSLVFLFIFLPLLLVLFIFIKRESKSYLLLLSGFFFYFINAGNYIILFLVLIIINYLFGIIISAGINNKLNINGKFFLIVGIIINVGLLVFYKYMSFFISNFNFILEKLNFDTVNIVQKGFPPGISFFTFLNISYLVDVYRKTASVCKNPFDYALYVSFFPKVLMGPITLFKDFYPNKKHGIEISGTFSIGVKRFIIGLGKKILIADSVSIIVNSIFEIPFTHQTFFLSWTGALAYTIQIYFDFSGYSDMAIGLGYMFGYKLPENFNYPYMSVSIKDFWKRWHMTLAAWLQTYLFLPIAYSVLRKIKGNTFLKIKTENFAYYTGSFFTMLLCGLWHGANWTFIIWGIYYGVLLIIEHAWLGKILKKKVPRSLRIIYSLFFIIIGWVIFRSGNLNYAYEYIKAMFGFGKGDNSLYYLSLYLNKETLFFMIIGIVGSFKIIPSIKNYIKESTLLLLLFIISIIAITAGTYNPFIYFNF